MNTNANADTDTDTDTNTSDDYDVASFRDRLEANPRPALRWAAGLAVLLVVELGRVATGVVRLGETVRFVLGAIAAIPGWVGGNVAGTLGLTAGGAAAVVTALVLLGAAGVVVTAVLPWSLVDRLERLDRRDWLERFDREETVAFSLERLLVTAVLAAVAVILVWTPLGAAGDVIVGWLTRRLESVASLQTLTSRETIPNEGYRTPDGGWEGTFLGLSPAWAWAIRVIVVYAYAFAVLAWLWQGYETFREHYREADWTPRDDSIARFRAHYWGLFGLAIAFAFVVMAIWAPALGPVQAEHNIYSPYQHEFQYLDGETVETVTHGTANLQSRSQGGESTVGPMSYDEYDRWAPLGTTQDGKDLCTFVVFGARTSLVIGVTAIGLGTTIALVMSLVTAYYKGVVDVLTIVASDTIISIPGFLLVLLLSVVFQEANHPIADVYDGGLLLALVFAGIYWPVLWRSIRGPSLQVAERAWVDAAKSYGQHPATTMRKHMAPYVAAYIMIYASLLLGGVIIATAALSFLGMGIDSSTPEWGRLVSDGRSYVSTSAWHVATVPGLLIVLVVVGFNALGDGIRDAIDPQSGAGPDAAVTASGGGG